MTRNKTMFKYNDIDVDRLIELARNAGAEIMKIYATDFNVETKDDKSPLTEADRKSNQVIIEGLKEHYPHIPYISEETKLTDYTVRKEWSRFWLIDPIDGTKEFIKKNGEFTVNISLVEDGVPVVGVVYAPALKVCYVGIKDSGSFRQVDSLDWEKLPVDSLLTRQANEVIVVASRSHLSDETLGLVEKLKAEGKEVTFKSSGSSLKFCLVAEGSADMYPRFGPTMEWDTGAAQAVAVYAGKKVTKHNSSDSLSYNKENLLNPWFIVD